jgi:Bacterial regulatory proteins, gntR family
MSRQLDGDRAIVKAGVARMSSSVDEIAMTTPEPVLRQEGVSLWRQIANRLQHDIGAGVYPPGGRLPTEAELAALSGQSTYCAPGIGGTVARWTGAR